MDTAATCKFEYTLERMLYMAIDTTTRVSSSALRNSFMVVSASTRVASIGTMSLSWKLTPYAPTSPSR